MRFFCDSAFGILLGVALVIGAVAAPVAWSEAMSNRMVYESIRTGTHPLDARCSYAPRDDAVCVAWASNSNRID
jgi:hypothetical protein